MCECCTLLHCAAMSAQSSVVQWLMKKMFPPVAKAKRRVDYIDDVSVLPACKHSCFVVAVIAIVVLGYTQICSAS